MRGSIGSKGASDYCRRVGPATFEAYEATPCGRLLKPGSHTGEAHYHYAYELLVVRSGSGTLACAGRNVSVIPGSAVLVAPGLVHAHARLGDTEARLQLGAIVAAFLGGPQSVPRACVGNPTVKAAERLLWDYQRNLGRYPEWQAYLRTHQPPVLAIWGAQDPFFIPAGAEAYKHDVPGAEVVLLDTGHFALVEELDAIAAHVDPFLRGLYRPSARPSVAFGSVS